MNVFEKYCHRRVVKSRIVYFNSRFISYNIYNIICTYKLDNSVLVYTFFDFGFSPNYPTENKS